MCPSFFSSSCFYLYHHIKYNPIDKIVGGSLIFYHGVLLSDPFVMPPKPTYDSMSANGRDLGLFYS